VDLPVFAFTTEDAAGSLLRRGHAPAAQPCGRRRQHGGDEQREDDRQDDDRSVTSA
jgi:hypothetical protein